MSLAALTNSNAFPMADSESSHRMLNTSQPKYLMMLARARSIGAVPGVVRENVGYIIWSVRSLSARREPVTGKWYTLAIDDAILALWLDAHPQAHAPPVHRRCSSSSLKEPLSCLRAQSQCLPAYKSCSSFLGFATSSPLRRYQCFVC